MVLVFFVAFSGLYNECRWRQESSTCADNKKCGNNSISLFAEAVSIIAVVGVSSNEDEDEQRDNSTSKDDDKYSDDDDDTTMSKADRSLSSSPSSKSSLSSSDETTNNKQASFGEIFGKAGRKALGGGLPGAVAGVIQVFTLMWLRTTINYQCRYGAPFLRAISILYKEGGVGRFYRGIGFALFQAPFSRFVATASNDGVLALLSSFPLTKHWTPAVTTVFASLTVGAFRILLMPIDTCKTVLQVDSREGFRALMRRVRAGKVGALYQGALATAASSTIGHYPWFVIFNALSSAEWLKQLVTSKLLRNASIGLVASVVSDTIVNVFRVIKTTKQSIGSKHDFSYSDTIRMIVAADGWKGLFGRGLRTRVFANALQSVMFTVIWRGLAERWGNNENDNENSANVNVNESDDGISKGDTAIKKGVRHGKRKPATPIDDEAVVEENQQ